MRPRWMIFNEQRRIQERCRLIKEELMMNRWHPLRVEKLLLHYGDIEDM
jgi:hypothetical protein